MDADDPESRDKIIDLNKKLNIKPFSYKSSEGHKHFWYKVDEHAQNFINTFKYNNSANALSFAPKVDTKSFNTERNTTGGAFLYQKGKDLGDRPTPQYLIQKLTDDLPVVPLFLLLPKE